MMKEVCYSSGSYIEIWLYPKYASMKLNGSCPVVASTNWSSRGREKLSFGYALLRFTKSMFGLTINTGLANRLLY